MNEKNTDRIVDVVIPTYNRVDLLIERLPSYFNQPEVNSVFVIDSGDNPDAEIKIKNISALSEVPIFYHRFKERQLQQVSKNFGIKKSTAPYIFIGEDDLELPECHFAILLEALKRKDADIVAGRRIYIKDSESKEEALRNAPTSGKIFYRVPFEGYFEAPFSGELFVPYLHANVLARREVFEKVIYDPRFRGNAFREELDFYLGCLRENFKMLLTSNTACFHLKSFRKKNSGSQTKRLKYEFYVWVNTFKCFLKNRDVLKKHFQISFPLWHAFICLLARYTNAIKRRIEELK